MKPLNANTKSSRQTRLAVALGLAVSTSLAAVPAWAEDPAATTATYGNWTLRCVQFTASAADGKAQKPIQNCEVVQTVQVQGATQPIAMLAIGRKPESKTLTTTAVLPVNISFTNPVHIVALDKDSKTETPVADLTWQRCAPAGCFANAELAPSTLKAFTPEAKGQLQFLDSTGRKIAVPLSWNGFQDAIRALDGK